MVGPQRTAVTVYHVGEVLDVYMLVTVDLSPLDPLAGVVFRMLVERGHQLVAHPPDVQIR
jgi:hypothetical protein